MARSHRWIDHTSELELELDAASAREVFLAALDAFRELAGDEAAGEPLSAEVELSAPDRAALLADWIGELAYLAETRGLVPERAAALALDGAALRATVEGRRGEPANLVKAATYHRLRLERVGGRWRGNVVLDV